MKFLVTSSIYSSTGITPFEHIFGHTNSRNPDEIIIPNKVLTNFAQNIKQTLVHVYE